MKELLSCPFCGKEMDINDEDTLYPSAIYWREEKGIRSYISHKDHIGADNKCYKIVCQEHYCGCGASIDGDSKEEVVEKWNKRKNNNATP